MNDSTFSQRDDKFENGDFENNEFEDIDYKPFNTLALIAFLLSLLSLVAWLNWLLFVIPVLAICLALLARHIGRGKLAGEGLASAALFFAVLFGSFSVGYHQFKAMYLGRIASQHAKTMMIEAFRENFGTVVDYMKPPRNRRPEGTEAAEFYSRTTPQIGGEVPPTVEVDVVLSQEPLPTLIKDEFKGKLEYLGVGKVTRDLYNDIIGVDFRYTPASADLEETEYRVIMLRRKYTSPLFVQWQVAEMEILKGPEKVRELIFHGSGPGGPPPQNAPK